jgi:hypothetical protein
LLLLPAASAWSFHWLCSALPLSSNRIDPDSATLLELSSAAVLSQLSSALCSTQTHLRSGRSSSS